MSMVFLLPPYRRRGSLYNSGLNEKVKVGPALPEID
jgi:hypothetical protein